MLNARCCPILTQHGTHPQISVKLPDDKCYENPLSVSGVVACGKTNLNSRSSAT
jgi:hypothetical protein